MSVENKEPFAQKLTEHKEVKVKEKKKPGPKKGKRVIGSKHLRLPDGSYQCVQCKATFEKYTQVYSHRKQHEVNHPDPVAVLTQARREIAEEDEDTEELEDEDDEYEEEEYNTKARDFFERKAQLQDREIELLNRHLHLLEQDRAPKKQKWSIKAERARFNGMDESASGRGSGGRRM